MQILVDGASQPTGQYLAAALFKSTGYQFQLATSSATNAVKGAILITTANALQTLGAEGYELTVAPDSVVIRAQGLEERFTACSRYCNCSRRRFIRHALSPEWPGSRRVFSFRTNPGFRGAG